MLRIGVIFRSCSRVMNVHQRKRCIDVEKSELITTCLNSVVESILKSRNPNHFNLTVLDDHSDSSTIEKIMGIMRKLQSSTFLSLEGTGNSASLKESYALARRQKYDFVYFVEDDYIHAPTALTEIVDAIMGFKEVLKQPVFIYPCDHPDRLRDPYPSLILASPVRYWRSVEHATGTLFCDMEAFDRNWEHFDQFSNYGKPGIKEDTTLNKIFKNTLCFSPMPSLTAHLQDEPHLPPFVNWKEWWDNSRIL